jgi:uncharacterized protein YcsI (UPF0317 family)
VQSPDGARLAARFGAWSGPTSGLAPGYQQANLVAVPRDHSAAFATFCSLNPRACPVLDVVPAGATEPLIAAGADVRTDLPRYRVYRDGELAAEPDSVEGDWSGDLVTFLLGCSYGFESALLAAGIRLRHIELGRNVAMYRTGLSCQPAPPFATQLVVSMRPIPAERVEEAAAICARFPEAHGTPVHCGDPAELGIADIDRPDFGEPVEVRRGEVPVFWHCGVTAVMAALAPRLPLVITHAPGHMFVSDRTIELSPRRPPRSRRSPRRTR